MGFYAAAELDGAAGQTPMRLEAHQSINHFTLQKRVTALITKKRINCALP